MRAIVPKLALALTLGFAPFLAHAITGGELVRPTDPIAKFVVGIITKSANGDNGYCTGTLLDSVHVITAGHCVQDIKSARIIFSREHIIDVRAIDNAHSRTASSFRLGKGIPSREAQKNPAVSSQEYNDLALLVFSGGLVPGYEAAPFLGVGLDEFKSILASAPEIVMAGYGQENELETNRPPATLKKTTLQLIGFREKGINFEASGKSTTGRNTGGCKGDSGGPAFIRYAGEYYLVGVTSRSDCNNTTLFTQFTGAIDNGQ